uniref:RING-type E3 ubiquitin transferase n=1 Tax=Salarias fasciatus TaxID=181472 RepID=A0A672JFM6_SALFA
SSSPVFISPSRYITCTEYTNFYGGKRAEIPQGNFRRLPFDHCSLSLQPFEYPVCTEEGVVFDLLSIVPWIKKYGTNPATGEVRARNVSLLDESMSSFLPGKYHCPVMFNVFTNNSHIVANRVTGNVFSFEAVEQLNIKTKSFKDLLTDEPFARKDIITLQDPTNLDKFNVSDFFHVKNNMKCLDPDEEKAKQDPAYHLKTTNLETRETLAELYKDYKGDQLLASTMKEPEAKKTDKLNAAHYSTGRVSASFTSTAMTPATTHEADAISDDAVRYQYVKKKGYVRLHTNKGDLNIELHCDKVPKAGENFIRLCKKGYYDGTIFHRSIRNFMVGAFLRPCLSKTTCCVSVLLSSCPPVQSFITFRSCTYLDRKHTVFGRVVGGFEALTAMENVESDPKTDKPKAEIKLISTSVFVDPYEEADAQIAAEREKEAQKQEEEKQQASRVLKRAEEEQPRAFRAGVGKYINPATAKRPAAEDDGGPSTSGAALKKAKGRSGFGDFSSW